MIPDNKLSNPTVVGEWLYPDNLEPAGCGSADYEMGGIALNDASQGLRHTAWEFRLVQGEQESEVYVGPIGQGSTLIFSAPDITEITGSFDSNMNPVLGYMQGANCRLRWFDTSIPGYTTTDIPGAISPRLCLDDKRPTQDASRDVLLFFLSFGYLAYRQQRDDYDIHRVLGAAPAGTVRLGRVGMTDQLRVQIEFLIA